MIHEHTKQQLPIFSIKNKLLDVIESSPVILTAPTGSGKSTEVPRWLAKKGNVLVIEPRRIAAKGLALRVSELENSTVGDYAGYAVKGESKQSNNTKIIFVTPGVAIKLFTSSKQFNYDTVILDEFHERTLETDFLGALLKESYRGRLVITSATINAKKIAEYFNGIHIHAEGRTYSVSIQYLNDGKNANIMPSQFNLAERIVAAVKKTKKLEGDVLIFLPGKYHIRVIYDILKTVEWCSPLILHGELSLKEQSAVYEKKKRKKIILSTNVAETSLTIPGIGIVIDSGLVKRTRYVGGRGFLTLLPIALDSADQRAGRAGRTMEGTCIRVWSKKAILEKQTPPQILRESLEELVLNCAAAGLKIDDVDFFDPPKEFAVANAAKVLVRLKALNDDLTITKRGERFFKLPLDAHDAAFLVECEKENILKDGIDLVSVILGRGDIFLDDKRPVDPADDLRLTGCDVTAFINAVRFGEHKRHRLNMAVLTAARKEQLELLKAFGVEFKNDNKVPFKNPFPLIKAAVSADPACIYIARHKKGKVTFSAGSKEIYLDAKSAVNVNKVEAVAVFSTSATGLGYREKDAFIRATCASPLKLLHLKDLNIGAVQYEEPKIKNGTVVCTVNHLYAGKIIKSSEAVPADDAAIKAIKELYMNNRIFKNSFNLTKTRFMYAALLKNILKFNRMDLELSTLDLGEWKNIEYDMEGFIELRLKQLGVESGSDLALLNEDDFIPPALPDETMKFLKEKFPFELDLKDIKYKIEYNTGAKEVTLTKLSGTRKDAPSKEMLPSFLGYKIKIKHHSRTWVLKK